MATVEAKAKYLRISPQKVSEVAHLVRGKPASEAVNILLNAPRRPAAYIRRVIESALANARDHKLEGDNFLLKELLIEKGPSFKRFRAGSMGRAMGIVHRTTHIKVVLTNEWDKK